MARIKVTSSVNSKTYCIIEDYKRNGKRTTKVVDYIGNYNKIYALASSEGIDINTWLNNYLINYKKENSIPTEYEEVIIKKNAGKIISKDKVNKFNVGYLFLKSIYYDLKIDQIISEISKKYKFEFDLNEVFANLIFARIIFPASKLKTYELSQKFIETPKYNLENIYRGLTYLNENFDDIQAKIYDNSKTIVDRDTRVIYYDCTNYYFDINEEDELRKYGKGKDHHPNPLVGMGLFMDSNGLPMAMNIYPGNANETTTLITSQEKIVANFDLKNKNTIICTDAAMCTDDIKLFNVKDGRSFVITQSIKKLKEEYQKEVLDDNNWRILGDLTHVYKLSDFANDEEKRLKHYETTFYKIVKTETKSVVQDLIVTFQFKYKDYLKNVRNGQVERARKKIGSTESGNKIKLSVNPNDYRRFIKEEVTDTAPKQAEENKNSLNKKSKKQKYYYIYEINNDLAIEEEKYDGYYGITTNLVGEVSEILKISKNRWEIEESFRILKTDFDSGTIHLSREDRITTHFLTCFISLLIYRILEKKLNYKYTNTQIIEALRDMEVCEEKNIGYSPAYIRTDLTDDLHELFGFRTDYEITSYKNYEKNFNTIKKH